MSSTNTIKKILLTVLLISIPFISHAEIYEWKDRSYSNNPDHKNRENIVRVLDEEWNYKLETSTVNLRPLYNDFDEIVGRKWSPDAPFRRAIIENRALIGKVYQSPNPAMEAYKIGLKYKFKQSGKIIEGDNRTSTKSLNWDDVIESPKWTKLSTENKLIIAEKYLATFIRSSDEYLKLTPEERQRTEDNFFESVVPEKEISKYALAVLLIVAIIALGVWYLRVKRRVKGLNMKKHQIVAIIVGITLATLSFLPVIFARSYYSLAELATEQSGIFMYPAIGVSIAAIIIFLSFLMGNKE